MHNNIRTFPGPVPTLRLTKGVAPPYSKKRKSDERILMEAMDVGDCFACPDDASYFCAQAIAAQMHIHTERRFRTKGTHRRVWRVS
jgi:hypothetical protein